MKRVCVQQSVNRNDAFHVAIMRFYGIDFTRKTLLKLSKMLHWTSHILMKINFYLMFLNLDSFLFLLHFVVVVYVIFFYFSFSLSISMYLWCFCFQVPSCYISMCAKFNNTICLSSFQLRRIHHMMFFFYFLLHATMRINTHNLILF